MSHLRLYTSNRLENLAEALSECIRQPLRSPLKPETILVQSQGMARWLKLELARQNGVCANITFPFPKLFCSRILTANFSNPDGKPTPDRSVMRWSIMQALPEMLVQPEFSPLNNYLSGPSDIRKRFQISGQIANLFDQYLVFRPDLILAWDEGRLFFKNTQKNPHEAWQAALWRRLQQDKSGQHLASLWKEIAANFKLPGFQPADVPERVSVFGISALPPIYLQLLSALGANIEVNLFLLHPSKEYWGSIVSAREAEKILKAVKQGEAAGHEFHLETGNRLLASMGQLGRDFLNLVLETDDWEDCSLFCEPEEKNLLQNIQADLFHLRDRGRQKGDRITIASDDSSVQVHSCHSPLREVEVLYDQLLDWFERDPKLTPRDVLVMMPDIEAYAPFIQAIFDSPEEEGKRIPFSLADRDIRNASQIIDAFLNLLSLPATRLEATHLLRLLEIAPVREKFSLTEGDLDLIRVWIRKTNIRWGKDAKYREHLGLPSFSENTWQQGLDRLLLGYAMSGGGEKMFQKNLPFDDVEGGRVEVLGHFAEFLNRVFGLVDTLEIRRPAGEWETVLLKMLDDFIQPAENQISDVLRLRLALKEISRQAAEARCEEAVDLAVILESLSQSLEADRFGSGFITGGVTFCALKPMRSIPFKIIGLIGMNDGAFPRSDSHLSFDLMAQQPRLGDRSLRADDRYLFLESLLSARARLHISYVGQDIRDNSEAPPSVLVSELLDYIAQACEVPGKNILKDQVVVRHRLQAFSPMYFKREDARLFSYSAENCRASHCGQQPRIAPVPFVDQPLSEPEADWRTVEAATLAEFFCNPAKALLTRRLGLRFEEADKALEEVEPFIVDGLSGYLISEELVDWGLNGKGLIDPQKLMNAAGRLPSGESGTMKFRELQAGAQAFLEQLKPYLGGGYLEPMQVDLNIGEFRVRGEVRKLTANGLLHYRCSGIKAKDRLRLWIQHLLLSATLPDDKYKQAVLVGHDEVLEFPAEKDAPAMLAELLELYWKGLCQPLKFFPKTSFAYAEAVRKQAKDPMLAARTSWEGVSYRNIKGEGEDDYYDLCFRNTEPLDEEFQQTALRIFNPLLREPKPAAPRKAGDKV